VNLAKDLDILEQNVCCRHLTYSRMKKKAINRLEKAKNAHDWGESHEDKDSEASVARNSTGEPCHA